MIRYKSLHRHPHVDAGTAVAVVLAQVQHQPAPRDLPIHRRVVVKPVAPVDLEAKVSEVELVRLGDVKYAKDWDDRLELDSHNAFANVPTQSRLAPPPANLHSKSFWIAKPRTTANANLNSHRQHTPRQHPHFFTTAAMHLMYTLDAEGSRVYTLKKINGGEVTKSAHPARFSPDDKYSRHRVTLKKRYGLLLTQQKDLKVLGQ
ncbi:hypothetical protein V493_01330 [Pseudogymnoascus sp. VKM F-4281 (FW-2241)]|nr:hypothetical protein V493_01330 [Pseudogymnoascus sp. VKM F-4281 (FW-2241)]